MNRTDRGRIARQNARDALSGAISPGPGQVIGCAACGAPTPKSRRWKKYCSDRCRRVGNRIRKESEVPADIRATLSRIEANQLELLSASSAILNLLREGKA